MNEQTALLLDPSDRAQFIIDELTELLVGREALSPSTAVALYRLVEREFDSFGETAFFAGYDEGVRDGDDAGFCAGYEEGVADGEETVCEECYIEGYDDGADSMDEDEDEEDPDFSGDPNAEALRTAMENLFGRRVVQGEFGPVFAPEEYEE